MSFLYRDLISAGVAPKSSPNASKALFTSLSDGSRRSFGALRSLAASSLSLSSSLILGNARITLAVPRAKYNASNAAATPFKTFGACCRTFWKRVGGGIDDLFFTGRLLLAPPVQVLALCCLRPQMEHGIFFFYDSYHMGGISE